MDIINSCCCCLLRRPDKYLQMPYTCLGTTEIYANMIKECFEIQLIISSYDECGICEVCVGRLRDASDFKLQVQRSQAELLVRLQGALHVKEEDLDKSGVSDGDVGPDCPEELIQEDPEKAEISGDKFGPDCREELIHVSDDVETGASDDPLPSDEGEDVKESLIEEDPEKAEISDDKFGPDCREELIHVSDDVETGASDDPLPSDEGEDVKESLIEGDPEKSEIPDDDFGLDCREELIHVSDDVKTGVSDDPLPSDEGEDVKESLIEGDPEKSEIPDDDFGLDCREELIHVSDDVKTGVSDDPLPSDEGEDFKESMIEGDPEKSEIPDDDISQECRAEMSDGYLPSDEGKEFTDFMIDEKKESLEVYEKEPLCPVTDLPQHYQRSAEPPLAKQNDNIRETCAQDTPRDSKSGYHRNPYTCDICAKQFSSQAGCNRHIARIHQADTEHICKICDKRFKWKSSLHKHNRSHTKVQPYGCMKCSMRFSFKTALHNHKLTHSKEQPFACGICDMRFSFKTYLLKHERLHKQVFVCDVCKAQFMLKAALICHIRSHATVLQCKFCSRTFMDRPSLRTHVRIEHAYNSCYICDECKRVFVRKKTLVAHLNVHNKWRIYQCNICELTLSSEGSLRRHKLVHTAERPYACEVCKKRFPLKQALIRHTTTHTGEKNYCCYVCGKKFALSDYLRTHLKIHAKETSFPCELCPKSYSTKESLRHHKRSHTKAKAVAKSGKKNNNKKIIA